MAKLKSEYLGKEFEVSSFEAQEEGETVEVVSHTALQDIAHNLLPPELKTQYSLEPLFLSPNHCVAKCVFADNTGRRIIEIGESMPNSLSTEIARNHPATMAFNRAFDKAFLRYLNVPGKVLSNLESNPTDDAVDNGETVVDVSNAPQKAPEPPQNVPNQQKGVNPSSEKKNAQGAPAGQPGASRSIAEPRQRPNGAQAQKAANTSVPAKPPQENTTGVATIEEIGNTLCNVGRYNNTGMTVARLYAEDQGYFNFICTKYGAKGAAADAIRNACIKYRALMEEKKNG